ncbi:hypothetical protein AMS56_27305 [Burkholderia pseudomallei]|nr:hypothetical protein UQ47_24670 [Burkholderia pseudomallei]ALC60448.1 hypothetical protein AMS56_27305 [Burkholderia pseudomallei]OMU06750.1 hypothetical protein AQ770_20645 [Burkholderia pseudomallei]OMU12445.1 hypothetical protein AQ769_01800 [Burkholderia pseudomallei]OMU36544.1 hypothetical protein AQ773_25835 [Burkholderia pseudomallei]
MSRAAFACRPADANRAPNAPSAARCAPPTAHACRHARGAADAACSGNARGMPGECRACGLSHFRVSAFE